MIHPLPHTRSSPAHLSLSPAHPPAPLPLQGLPLNQYGREKGNAEITPLQVDPSVTFDTVGGLDHYIRVGGVAHVKTWDGVSGRVCGRVGEAFCTVDGRRS